MTVRFPRHVAIVVVVAVCSSTGCIGVFDLQSGKYLLLGKRSFVCKTLSSCVYPYSTTVFTCVTC